ncbi:hypothetical protein J6590_061731 [Homalodisca vitripennis]|nr:hypothetical protein J6590_061731 [Homalodisca vitripennis]
MCSNKTYVTERTICRMEWLPLEMVRLIAENLTAKDLSACIAVSVSWRNIFNQDSLWKPHCNISIAEYLETAECQVQPGFVAPVMENKTLSPICHWKMCFMRENHLFKNWREIRYVVNKVDITCSSTFFYTFISHDYVIEFTSTRAMLWDVRNNPVYLRDPFCLPFDFIVNWCGMISDNIFCVVQGRCVQVYHFNTIFDDKWDLKHMFFVNEDEMLSPSDSEMSRLWLLLRHMLIIGNILVGCDDEDGDRGVLHVWNIEEGKKLRRIDCTMISDSHTKIHRLVKSEKLSLDFVIILETELIQQIRYSLKGYSLKELDFSKFNASHDMSLYLTEGSFDCVLQDRFVAITFCGFIYVYNYLTSQLVATSAPTHSLSAHYNFNVFSIGDRILFSEDRKLNMIFNTNTLLITSLIVNNEPEECVFVKSLSSNLFITRNGMKFSLWEMGRHIRFDSVTCLNSLALFPNCFSYFEVNKSCTKLALNDFSKNYFIIASFW